MKLTTLLKSLVAALALPGAAFAAHIEWTSGFYNAPLDFLNRDDVNYSNTFNLTLDGFDSTSMQIESAKAYFAFADDGDNSEERIDISIEGVKVVSNREVNGSHNSPPESYDWIEVTLSQSLIDNLESDGLLSFLVQLTNTSRNWNNKNDTYLKIAHLVANGHEKTPPPPSTVPDAGATALLVGLGLAGMVALRRRRA